MDAKSRELIERLERLEGETIGGCRLGPIIGRGGMGSVYRALHIGLNKEVAVKLIPALQMNDDSVRRFLAEARSAAKLEHPNITQVYNVGFEKGYCFIIMQLLDGRSLADLAKTHHLLPIEKVLSIIRGIAAGLSAAHAKGVVHRDLKPDNIMLTKEGQVKITDFGLAHDRESGEKTRTIAGTPLYMAPEQWRGGPVDGRTDLYALGIILYLLLTGRRPFNEQLVENLMRQHLKEEPPPIETLNPTAPKTIIAVVRKLLAKDPTRRYASATALVGDLDRIRGGIEPLAMADFEQLIACPFCDTLNPPQSRRCKVCNEPLEKVPDKVALAAREDEFACPACGEFVRIGSRECSRCKIKFCEKCRREVAEKGAFCLGCAVWT